jgi:hypothetical protein
VAGSIAGAIFLVLAMATLFVQAASAQTLDPRALQQLQQQLGSGPLERMQQPGVPTARDVELPGQMPGMRIDTPEEQELRRAEARRALQRLYEPSPIERDYRRRLNEPQLRQFGYDFFLSAPGPTGVRTGAVGDDYVLGIGDCLLYTSPSPRDRG